MASNKTGGGRSSTACSTVCLLNRHFKMLRKSFPVAPTAATAASTKTTAVGAQN